MGHLRKTYSTYIDSLGTSGNLTFASENNYYFIVYFALNEHRTSYQLGRGANTFAILEDLLFYKST